MRFPFVKRKDYEKVVYKLECLLDHATGGRLSYHTYPLSTMLSAVTNYMQESCADCDRVEVVRCADCKHLVVINSDTKYAYCVKTRGLVEPFAANGDTREEFCNLGERKERV